MIYTGTWEDGDGVDFDPAAFSIQETPGPSAGFASAFGNPNPDCTGSYVRAGIHNGLPYFERDDTAWVLWWDSTTHFWNIDTAIDPAPANYWRAQASVEGDYYPEGTRTGRVELISDPFTTLPVSGTTNPDCTGTYTKTGTYNNTPYWYEPYNDSYLYWNASWGYWMIGPALDDNPADYWYGAYPLPFLLQPGGAYTGEPIITYPTMPDLTVTGNPNPDATGTYEHSGLYNGFHYWTRDDAAFAIWWHVAISRWRCSVAPGNVAAGCWENYSGYRGLYTRVNPYTGDLYVSAFAELSEPGWGIARMRIFGRRGGCGSPPGQHHGSTYQANARLSFGNRAREYVDMPPASPDTQWEIDGQAANHYTRAGAFKKMHGQAFYPRSTNPKTYGGNAYLLAPDAAKTFPPIDDLKCVYDVAFNWATLYLHFTGNFTGGIYSGLSIFQVNPRSAGKSWERKHTRIAWSSDQIDGLTGAWSDWPFFLVWPCTIVSQLRILVRVWNYEAFSPWAPITAEAP